MPSMDDKFSTDPRIDNISSKASLSEYKEHGEATILHLHQTGRPVQFTDKQDDALDILTTNSESIVFITAQDNARILRMIDRNIMPIMFAIYFLQMMDKQTIALSSVFGLSRETGLAGEDYSLVESALYIAQLLFQPLSAFFLVKFRLSVYVPVIVTCWGITSACMAAARGFSGLLVARVFLGAFEASIQGAYILTAQTWYRRREQGIRLAIWYSNSGLVNIVGPLIMFGIGHIHSTTLYSYQIVSVLLGAITIAVGLVAFSCFPDNPVKCKFLNEGDKVLAVERIRANQQGLAVNVFKISQVVEMFLDIKSWCWMGLSLLVGVPSGGIITFGPLIVRGFGFNGDKVMLLLIPFGVLQIMFLVLGFWANEKLHKKWPVIAIASATCLAASIILLVTRHHKKNQPVLLFAYYLLSANLVSVSTIMNWQSANVAGQTKKTATTAFMIMGLIAGSIIGPLLFNAHDKPYYHKGILVIIICYCIVLILIACTVSYLKRLNEWNRKRLISRGKSPSVVDYSMIDATAIEIIRAANHEPVETGKHAFDDLTDLQNDEFIYVY